MAEYITCKKVKEKPIQTLFESTKIIVGKYQI